jgi:hypothetical protein
LLLGRISLRHAGLRLVWHDGAPVHHGRGIASLNDHLSDAHHRVANAVASALAADDARRRARRY